MSIIIQRMPFFDTQTTAPIPGGPSISIKHRQIIVWVALTLPGAAPPTANAVPRFPALVDLGFNDSFVIQEEQLMAWTGFGLADFSQVGRLTIYGRKAPMIDADILLYPNVPGSRDDLSSSPPFRLQFELGVGVCPIGTGVPRIPLLGVRAFHENGLSLLLNGAKRRVSIRSMKPSP